MAIRDDNTPPSKPGSITQTADNQIDRIGNVSNVSKTVSAMQKDVKQQITETKTAVEEGEAISSVQNSMTKVLDKLSDTVGALSTGVKTITVDTAKATKDAIGDYGKAISQDISFNKQSVVAMALARSTPIYGYFVAKFMETDVFKRAAERMKQSIGKAFGSLAGLFRRGAKEPGKEKIPHMQKGGYVEKEGVAKLHAAEVVMPIEKILERMDESTDIARNVTKILSKVTMQQAASSKSMQKMIMTQTDQPERKVGLFRDALRFVREGRERFTNPTEIRQLRELISIREVLGGQLAIWPEIWSKLLMKHPGFRNMMAVTKLMTKFTLLTTWKPVYALFRRRGGYSRALSTADQPLVALNQNIGELYVGSMWRFDNMLNLLRAIAIATRDTASGITGKKYSALKGVGEGRWSVAGLATRGVGLLGALGMKGLGMIPGMGFLGKGGEKLKRLSLTSRASREYALGETEISEKAKKERLGTKKKPIIMTRLLTKKQAKQEQLQFNFTKSSMITMKTIRKKLRSNWILKYLLLGWGIFKGFINNLFGNAKKAMLSVVKMGAAKFASWLGLGGLGRFGVGKKGAGKMLGKLPAGMGKVMGAGGIVAGVAMGVYDAFKAVALSKEWQTSKMSAGIGGFFGGTGSGVSGALKGAAKGGLIGAGIGSVVPVIGTAIGGAVGAIAGGIMGFVGGKNIAKGLDAMGAQIKKLAKGAWNIISYPWRMQIKVWQWIKTQFKWDKMKENIKKLVKTTLKYTWEFIKLPYRAVWGLLKLLAPNLTEKVANIAKTIKNIIMYPVNWINNSWQKVLDYFSTDDTADTTHSSVLGFVKWPFNKVKSIADSVRTWVSEKFNVESVMNSLKKPMNALFGVFAWFGDLFGKIKNSIVEGISKIPGAKWFLKDDKGPKDKPSGSIKDTITAGTEASKRATKSIWGKVTGLWKKGEPSAKAATSSLLNKMTPKTRKAFETAKQYYMKEFGWTEAQADTVLQTIAATAGDKLDSFNDPEKLKSMATGMYRSAAGGIKERYLASIDKGQIVVNQAHLALANGELIADDLGKKIVDSSNKLGQQTLQGAGAVVSTVSTAITSNNVTNNSAVSTGGGSGSDGRSYFDDLVYRGRSR